MAVPAGPRASDPATVTTAASTSAPVTAASSSALQAISRPEPISVARR